MCHFCEFFGDFLGLAGSWGQDGPQTCPKRASKTDFGAILVVKMDPRSPKTAQEAPRDPQETVIFSDFASCFGFVGLLV